MRNKFLAALLLLAAVLLVCTGCGKQEEAPVEPVDELAQFTDAREYFLARMIATNYQGRYETLIEATANASTSEQVTAAYAAYGAGFENVATDYMLEVMAETHDPYIYDEREFEQGDTLRAVSFSFTEISAENKVTNYSFVIEAEVSNDMGLRVGTITGQITVRDTEDGPRVGNYFFQKWLEDLHEVSDSTEEPQK